MPNWADENGRYWYTPPYSSEHIEIPHAAISARDTCSCSFCLDYRAGRAFEPEGTPVTLEQVEKMLLGVTHPRDRLERALTHITHAKIAATEGNPTEPYLRAAEDELQALLIGED